jgi:hypothetical protein
MMTTHKNRTPGVYGNSNETFVLTERGLIYLIQSPDMPKDQWMQRTLDIPDDVQPISNEGAADITVNATTAFGLVILHGDTYTCRTMVTAGDESFWVDSSALNDEIPIHRVLLDPADTYSTWCWLANADESA